MLQFNENLSTRNLGPSNQKAAHMQGHGEMKKAMGRNRSTMPIHLLQVHQGVE